MVDVNPPPLKEYVYGAVPQVKFVAVKVPFDAFTQALIVFNVAATSATFTGSISSTTLTVSSVTGTIKIGQVVTGGTNGNSILTDLTIPILLRETAVDIGYYSVFDRAILQADVVKNFVLLYRYLLSLSSLF